MTINTLTGQDDRHCRPFLQKGSSGSEEGYGCYDGTEFVSCMLREFGYVELGGTRFFHSVFFE